jgi:hypothetical protein
MPANLFARTEEAVREYRELANGFEPGTLENLRLHTKADALSTSVFLFRSQLEDKDADVAVKNTVLIHTIMDNWIENNDGSEDAIKEASAEGFKQAKQYLEEESFVSIS